MAKSRKKARKAVKRTAVKRKTVKAKARRSGAGKRRSQTSIIDAVRETRELRSRLAGHNTFED